MPLVSILIVALMVIALIGGILWFTIGRNDGAVSLPRMPRRGPKARTPVPAAPHYEPLVADTRTSEQQIADLDREIEEWRLRAEIAKRRHDESDAS